MAAHKSTHHKAAVSSHKAVHHLKPAGSRKPHKTTTHHKKKR